MPSEKHEKMLVSTIKELRAGGLRVVRLDSRSVPDAFILKGDGEIIAVEIETDSSKIHSRIPEFDGVITISKQKEWKDHKPETYFKVLSLRKEHMSYNRIREYMQNIYGVKLSLATLHAWCRGKQRPRSIRVT